MPAKMVSNPLDVAQAIVNGEVETEFEEGAIYVGNVDYEVTKDELNTIFSTCGTVKKVRRACRAWAAPPLGQRGAFFCFESGIGKCRVSVGGQLRRKPVPTCFGPMGNART